MIKRLFDIAGSALALAVFSPVLIVVSLLVRLDSSGPILFRQARVGRQGRIFLIKKFRTMNGLPDSSATLVTSDGDSRITRIGKWLRKSKLDELPQLLNVLRGEMSFVGPRPEVPKYIEYYPPASREKILSVRPGITDEAAILFRDESGLLARTDEPEKVYLEKILPAKIALYEKYVDQQSLMLDLGIIIRTVAAIILGSGIAGSLHGNSGAN